MSGTGHEIGQLSYACIGVQQLSWWRRFAQVVGFALAEDSPADELWLRMDHQRDYRIVLHESEPFGLHTLGWETRDAAGLAALGERLRTQGVRVDAAAALAGARRVEELLEVRDPDGVRCELFWGGNCALRKPLPLTSAATFNAGALGFGHATMAVTNAAATLRFYMQGLGLRLSDAAWMEGHSRVYFLRCNSRHHSYAFAQMPGRPAGTVHVMADIVDLDALGEIRDRLLDAELPISRDLGSHPLDGVVSLYVATPEGFEFELACGTRMLDEDGWESDKFARRGRPWGHRRPAPTKGCAA
jgi:3,4-dihydroxy-9,10-secoandrosta-1,3,5(10)-triene-9,17-dione 4,5-dioxygenase